MNTSDILLKYRFNTFMKPVCENCNEYTICCCRFGSAPIRDSDRIFEEREKILYNLTLSEMIEIAKKSEYGAVWYSEKGPIQITKEGKLEPI